MLNDGKLIWVDIETTGLDVNDSMNGCKTHKILELAMHITDDYLNILDKGFKVTIHYPPAVIQDLMNDFVTDMHTKNGLLKECEDSIVTLSFAEELAISYLESNGVIAGKSPMCGNSVSFDKNFINAQMPRLASFFHYRLIDVSSFKEIAKRFNPEAAWLVEHYKNTADVSAHRALDDIKLSIDEMKIYADYLLK